LIQKKVTEVVGLSAADEYQINRFQDKVSVQKEKLDKNKVAFYMTFVGEVIFSETVKIIRNYTKKGLKETVALVKELQKQNNTYCGKALPEDIREMVKELENNKDLKISVELKLL